MLKISTHVRRVVGCALIMTATGGASSALAASAEERATAAVETRQGLLKVVVSYFGPIVGMARQQIPYDGDVVADNAARIAELAAMIPHVFRNDTRAHEIPTESLPKIWDNLDDFNAKAATAAERAAALAAAAGEGQGPAMKAFGELGAACKACHDEYRQQN